MGLGLGLGLQFYRRIGAAIDAQAQAHYNRVIADGGLVPSGLSGVNAFFTTVKSIYATADITTAISVGLDAQVLGYKLGAGAGTTLGQAAQKLYSCSGASGDVVQTTAASQPLLLVHEGANYWWGSGVDGNYVSTPDAPANRITGDIDIIIRGSLDNNPTGNNIYFSKWENSGNVFFFGTDNTGKLRAGFSIGGGNVNFASSSVNYTTGLNWYRLTRVASTGAVTFYQSTQQTNDINSVIWGSPLGTIQSTTSGNLDNLNTIVSVFKNDSGSVVGKIYRATISNSIGGAPVVDFNPNQYNAANSQTQWTSSTGEVWTINTGTDATGYKGVLVDRTIVQSDGIDDLLSATISGSGRFTQYLAVSPFGSITSNEAIAGPWSSGDWRGAIYTSSSRFATYQGSGTDGVFGSTITKAQLNLVGVVNSSTGTDWQPFINGTDVSNDGLNIGSQNDYISVRIFARSGGVTFTNSLVNSYILGKQADDSTQRTDMYNYIKSINNNAF
jgi:hypothetical protein